MIQDVRIKKCVVHADDRGNFREIFSDRDKEFNGIPVIRQTNYTRTHPGVIKAFHWHEKQWDIWHVVEGSAQVILYDLRKDSKTFNQADHFFPSEENKIVIAIPPGVAHGYRVLGASPVGLLYHVTEPYDPANPDEKRISWNGLPVDWATRHR